MDEKDMSLADLVKKDRGSGKRDGRGRGRGGRGGGEERIQKGPFKNRDRFVEQRGRPVMMGKVSMLGAILAYL